MKDEPYSINLTHYVCIVFMYRLIRICGLYLYMIICDHQSKHNDINNAEIVIFVIGGGPSDQTDTKQYGGPVYYV